MGRIADVFRIAWGLIYWNVRKTMFRANRERTRCPCQNPSDSGRAMETGCDPALPFADPKRFRRVCPLLKPNAQGHWLCSVNTPDVRPFWIPAGCFYLSGAAILYLGLTVVAWTFLHVRGYPIRYAQVALPTRWHEFPRAQSRYFAAKAQRALTRHDPSEAIMSLSIAYQLDPSNYPIGLLFARLTQAEQPELSDRIYARLDHDHPEHRIEILNAWYDSLLWRGDFSGIENLVTDALAADPDHANAWLNALIIAFRRQPDLAAERKLLTETSSPAAKSLLTLDLKTVENPAHARDALLTPPAPNAPSFLNFYIPRRLIETGSARDAVSLLTSSQLQLSPRDRLSLLLDAYAALGWDAILRQQFEQIAGQPLNAPAVEVLASFLIRHPNRELLAEAFDAFQRQVPSAPDVAYPQWSAWLFAAGAAGDFQRFQTAAQNMKAIAHSDLRALDAIKAFFQGNAAHTRIESYLPVMQPLPLDITYALLEHYYQPREKAAIAKP